jgi:hypothetical protein
MSARLLVAIPLCDYEPLATKVWNRRATYYLVRACLRSFARTVRTPLTMYVLADRCSDGFVRMAQRTLRRFKPVTVDNSTLRFGLDRTSQPERFKHIANQFLRTLELASGHDVLYFCEQDYLFRTDPLADAMAAFAEIPRVNVLSPFDHPDRHRADRDAEHGRLRLFPTSRSTWKSVSSTNGNWLWRVSFADGKAAWLERMLKNGEPDYRFDNQITSALYREDELLLCPVRSLVQHYRLDGSNASPTYGFSVRMALTSPIGRGLERWNRVSARIRGAAVGEPRQA